MSHKQESMAKIIHRLLATPISRELHEFEFGIITLTRVELSKNCDYADCYVSCLQNKPDLKHALRSKVYFLQQVLNKHFQKRKVPKIRFFTDVGPEHHEKIQNYFKSEK